MRIIAGELKGREITLPKNSRIRPATGFVREMVMNLLTPERLEGAIFLDICAGSGLMGFEALSRGAARIIFVEADARTAAQLRTTAEMFGVRQRVSVLPRDARTCYNVLRKALDGTQAGVAFLDPPYIRGMAGDILERLAAATDILAADAAVLIRTPDELPEAVGGLVLDGRRNAGNGQLWSYRVAVPDVDPGRDDANRVIDT